MQEVLHKARFRLRGRAAKHVSNHDGLHMNHLAVEFHALEDAIQHLRQRGLGCGLVHGRAAH